MAIIVYQCDTCKRSVEKNQNKSGLEIVGRCVITDNCKGVLHQQAVKQTSNIDMATQSIKGLDDWAPRKVLHTHEQELAHKTWRVSHSLNTHPAVNVSIYGDDVSIGDKTLTEYTSHTIEHLSKNEFLVHFTTNKRGVAQCIARTTAVDGVASSVATTVDSFSEAVQLTTNQELTIATLDDRDVDIEIAVQYLTPSDLTPITTIDPMLFSNTNSKSTWHPYTKALINGRIYTIRSASIDAEVLYSQGVSNGSPMYFGLANNTEITPGSVLILLTTAPFESTDRHYTNVIDLTSSNHNNAAITFRFNQNELEANAATVESIYPPIYTPQ